MVSMSNTKDGKRSRVATSTEEMDVGDTPGVDGIRDAQFELDAIVDGYRTWAGQQRQTEEQWRRE